MRFVQVELQASDAAEAERFFSDVLRLPTVRTESSLRVSVGSSLLVLTERSDQVPSGVHHLAFDVPATTFAAHRDWLAARLPLLASANGTVEFEGPAGWNSRSIYFEGPDRMVLELIARRNRPEPPATSIPQLVSISEVGIAVADVPAAVATLGAAYGLEVFGAASAEFAPVGDEEGLLIVVAEARAWLPVFDVVAAPLPLEVEAAGLPAGGGVALNSVATIRAASS